MRKATVQEIEAYLNSKRIVTQFGELFPQMRGYPFTMEVYKVEDPASLKICWFSEGDLPKDMIAEITTIMNGEDIVIPLEHIFERADFSMGR